MRSTSYVHFDDCVCEVKSHCHLDSRDQGWGNKCAEGVVPPHDPDSSPQEHSAEHPARFEDPLRRPPKP